MHSVARVDSQSSRQVSKTWIETNGLLFRCSWRHLKKPSVWKAKRTALNQKQTKILESHFVEHSAKHRLSFLQELCVVNAQNLMDRFGESAKDKQCIELAASVFAFFVNPLLTYLTNKQWGCSHMGSSNVIRDAWIFVQETKMKPWWKTVKRNWTKKKRSKFTNSSSGLTRRNRLNRYTLE